MIVAFIVDEPKLNQQTPANSPQPFLRSGLMGSFKKIKKTNSRISMRAFAKRLGISHSAMSEILNGKRRVSKEKAEQFADALHISGEDRKIFLSDFRKVDPTYQVLPDEVFQALADPDYFHVLTLVDTRNFSASPEWIAKRLGITSDKSSTIFKTLQDLKLIAKNKEGEWQLTNNRLSTKNDIASKAIQMSHQISLDRAKDALTSIPVNLRFFLSATMSTDNEKYRLAIDMLKDTMNRISELFETSEKEEVYKLQIALFPVTKTQERNEGNP